MDTILEPNGTDFVNGLSADVAFSDQILGVFERSQSNVEIPSSKLTQPSRSADGKSVTSLKSE
jgi:hypothetical protein